MTGLRLAGVNKSFGRPVLADIDLEVAPGELVAVVGASGCGKSTLLRLVAGLERPDRGTLTLDGQPLTGPGPDRGVVFQEPRLLPWLTAAENIAFPRSLRAASGPVAELVALVGLRGHEQARPHELSGGMAQRVALARALISQPPVLLLDEPLGALDAITRAQLQDELAALQAARTRTTLLVTHDVEEAVYLADRVVLLAGRPATIAAIIPVALPRPRQREEPRFLALRRRVQQALAGPAAYDQARAGGIS